MSNSIPRDFIELLLAKTDLVDLIKLHVPLQKKSSNNYFARCPFHQEKSASFSVSHPKQFYYCFGCGAHGNAIDFIMNFERLSFPEAIEALARSTGMEIPRQAQTDNKKSEKRPDLYQLMTHVADFYYEQMRHSERAIHYLKQRGISGAIAKQFHLGYAPHSWDALIQQFGKTDPAKKQLLDAGLIIKKDNGGFYDRFRDRIMFPIRDIRGRVIGFGGRILDQGEPKYLNSPETSIFQKGHELYGLYETLKSNRQLARILIVEGYMDVIALFQHGVDYSVATMGTATTPHHLQRLFRYTSEIVFCFDGDTAGRTAAWRALQVIFPIMHDSLQIRFLFLPDTEDPDSIIRKESKAAFNKRIAEASSLSEFFFHTLKNQADLNSMEGRARYATLALTHIKELRPSLFQSMMLEELSKRTRIDLNDLKNQVKSTEAIAINPQAAPEQKMKIPGPIKLAIALLIQNPSLISEIKEPLPDLDLPGFTFLRHLIEIVEKNSNITTGALVERWRDQKEGSWIAKMAHLEHMIPEAGITHEFTGALRQLLILGFDKEINRLLAKAAQESLTDEEKIALSTWISKKKCLITITNQ